MEWNLKATGVLGEHEQLGKTPAFLSCDWLLKMLKSPCYNLRCSAEKKIELPASTTSANIVTACMTNDAGAMVRLPFTDPRVSDEDCLFFDNDAFLATPEELTYLGNLSAGLSCQDACHHR